MYVCMYVCMCMHVCVCVSVCMYVQAEGETRLCIVFPQLYGFFLIVCTWGCCID